MSSQNTLWDLSVIGRVEKRRPASRGCSPSYSLINVSTSEKVSESPWMSLSLVEWAFDRKFIGT